jgi:hypothetical protein
MKISKLFYSVISAHQYIKPAKPQNMKSNDDLSCVPLCDSFYGKRRERTFTLAAAPDLAHGRAKTLSKLMVNLPSPLFR